MMDILTSRVYRQEKSAEVMLSILNFAVEYRNGEGGAYMSGVEYPDGSSAWRAGGDGSSTPWPRRM